MEETTLQGRAVRDITWEEFQTLFLRKFFSRYSRDRRYQEFLSLSQGDLSVEEYTSRFSELRRYAPHQDEKDMAMRYREWLHSAQHVTVGSTGVVCEEETWQFEDVHRLQDAQ